MDSDSHNDETDLRHHDETCASDDRNDTFCSVCMNVDDDSSGFEKILNFENAGIIIYRRLQEHKQLNRKGKMMDTFKTVIVRNTSDMDFTSEDLVRELQKKEISCDRCRHIIELALTLLHKVPLLNKKAIMGICDRCKLIDPCRACNETTKSFLSKYKVKGGEELVPDRLNTWEDTAKNVFSDNATVNPTKTLEYANSKKNFEEKAIVSPPKKWDYTPLEDFMDKITVESVKKFKFLPLDDILDEKVSKKLMTPETVELPAKSESALLEDFLDKKIVKQPLKSESTLRIEELLRQEYNKSKRYIEISDLCPPPTPHSTKSLPAFNVGKKYSKSVPVEQTLKEPSVQKGGKNIVDNTEILTITGIMSDDNTSKTVVKLQGYFRTTNIDLHKQPEITAFDKQIKKSKHVWKHEDGDIFPKHRKPYAHAREISPLVTFDNDDFGYKHLVKKHVKEKEIYFPKPSHITPYQTATYTPPEQRSEFEPKSIIKKEKPARKQKPRVDEPDEFSYSFPFDSIKLKKEPAEEKDSIELVKEIQDKKDDITRRKAEMRLQKKTELERKRLEKEEYTVVIARKGKARIATKKMNAIKNDELSHIEEAIETKEVNQDTPLKKNKLAEHRLAPKIESEAQEHQLKSSSKSISSDKARKSSIKEKEGALLKKDKEDTLLKVGQDTPLKKNKLAEEQLAPKIESEVPEHQLKSSSNSITSDKALKSPIKEKEGALLKKDKEDTYLKQTKEETILKTGKERTSSKQTKGGMRSKKEKEGALSKKEKEEMAKEKLNALLRGENVETDLEKQEEKKKVHKKEKDEETFLKIKIIPDKKQKENDNVIIKGIKSKVPQSLKQLQEIGLRDMIRKNVYKPKDVSQLARLQNLNDQKREDSARSKSHKKTNDTNKTKRKENTLDIKVHKIKDHIPTPDTLFVEFKEEGFKYKYKGKSLREHCDIHEKCHKFVKDPGCPFCLNSDLELQANLSNRKVSPERAIQGKNIVEVNKLHDTDGQREPLLFSTHYEIPKYELGDNEKKLPAKLEIPKSVDHTLTTNGVINYALSDRTFIDKGWTVLPTEKVMRKMNVYRMRPAKPEFDWFKRNKDKTQMFYDSGELFAQHEDDGRCRWYYKNQRLALDYYQAEETNVHQRFVIYSNGEPDERGRTRPYTILAMFDHLGNGVVFDHGGKIRLKYNQTEGVILDRSLGPVSHWKWHSLNDPPELQKVMIDTQLHHKDQDILAMDSGSRANLHVPPDSLDDMLVIEFDNVVREKSKKLSQNFKPFQIKMKAMKINEHFSLKVLDQANVYLIYRDGTTNVKLNLGLLLDHKEIVDTDTVEVGEVDSSLERLPARTDSLAAMQQCVQRTQHLNKMQVEYEERIRHPVPRFSVDKMAEAVSRPMRFPLRSVNFSNEASTSSSTSCPMNRNILTNGVYYATS